MLWTVLIPVKRLTLAKSRLRGTLVGTGLAGVEHTALVLAMALDTVEAAAASPLVGQVVVITADETVAHAVARTPARIWPDSTPSGLNGALSVAATGLREAGATWLAALAGDLPALRSSELSAVLRTGAREHTRWFVPDAAGTGTVALMVADGVDLAPRFGPDSAAAHAASRAVALVGDWPGLRRDVDTGADLREALALGVGRHTLRLAGRTGCR